MIEVIEEIWKPIKNYEEFYEISNLGNVKAKERIRIDKNGVKRKYKEKILLPSQLGYFDKYGRNYLKIGLYDKFKTYTQFLIHRLVAIHFIPNPDNKPEVNHKDENKENNNVNNLEWCTRTENNEHSKITENLNNSKKIKINQLSLNGEFIKEWDGIREAARGIGAKSHKHISCCCKGTEKTAQGFKWEYKHG